MSWSGQASEHDADHGESDPGGDGSAIAFEVAGEMTVAADPGEAAFDDPAFGQDDEAVGVAAFDDLDRPMAGGRGDARQFRPLIAGIGEDALDEGELPARLA